MVCTNSFPISSGMYDVMRWIGEVGEAEEVGEAGEAGEAGEDFCVFLPMFVDMGRGVVEIAEAEEKLMFP